MSKYENTYYAANDTIFFKIAVGTYEKFISTPIAVETIDNTIVYEKDKIVISDTWTKEVYRLLLRRYKNWEIANDTVDDFLDMLWERIEIHTPNYFERKSRYQQLLSLSDSELLTQGRYISNFVEHTDDRVNEPLAEPLKNISNQTASQNYGDNSGRIRTQIHSAQMNLIEDFLNKFKNLFLKCSTKSNYLDYN